MTIDTMKYIGTIVLGLVGVAFFLIPDPIAVIVKVYRYFRKSSATQV